MKSLANRVAARLWTTRKPQDLRIDERPFQLSTPFRLFLPEHYESRYEYPLFIWLHSHASSEGEMAGVMSEISLRNYIGLGLRGVGSVPHSNRLFSWGSSLTDFQAGEDRVLESIQEISEQLPIHPHRIFLAGFGEAGTLAQWIALRNAERFAGVVSIHGGFPRRFRPLIQWKAARQLPTLFMYGEHASLCDTDDVCRSIRIARNAGLSYSFNQFDCGDELYADMCQAANRFMMSIINDGQPNLPVAASSLQSDSLLGS
jgi:phospholipase/carboxylesterase